MNLLSLKKIRVLLGWLLLPLAGQGVADSDQEVELIRNPEPSHFNICFNHGCQSLADVKLAPEQWHEIRQFFSPATGSPQEERSRIAQAVGKLETLVGKSTSTDKDRGGNIAGLWMTNQMDCIDESTNTYTYLVMMKNDGLLKYHKPSGKATRILPYIFPHTTAVIQNISTEEKYAVDSWFMDNGQPPYVVPLGTWRWGWKPGNNIPDIETEIPAGSTEAL